MKTKILLIDDHAVVRAGLKKALEEVDNIVVVGEAADGSNIEEAIAQYDPNCLLIDVTMPNFEPLLAIKGLRQRYPDLKILVVSAYDDDVYVQGLLSAGVNGYHLKDQPLSDLVLAVERVMRGERWVSSRLLDRLLNTGGPKRGQTQKPVSLARRPRQLPPLTQRQKGILKLLQKGYDNQRIALDIGISIKTVENHLTRLYRVLGVQSRLEAVNLAGQYEPSKIATPSPVRSSPNPAPLMPLSYNGVILIVDDNSRFRHQLKRTLLKIAPQALVVEASNTAETLPLAKRYTPPLSFVDVVLGNEDGVYCTRLIRPLIPNGRIILMTAYPDREFRQHGMAAGAAALLDKKDLDSRVLRGIAEDALG